MADPDTIILFSHSLTDAFYANLKTTPGNQPNDFLKQGLSYHIYCWPIGDPTDLQLCNDIATKQLSRDWSLAERLKVGAIMTEFGAVSGMTSPGLMNMQYLFE